MLITPKILIEAGAKPDCAQLEMFCNRWPDGCEVTLERCLEAARAGLDIIWAATHLLPEAALVQYCEKEATAWVECRGTTAAAWNDYWAKEATALFEAIQTAEEAGGEDA